MKKWSCSELVSILGTYLQGMNGCYRKVTWQMEEDMHFCFDVMVDIRNAPLKQGVGLVHSEWGEWTSGSSSSIERGAASLGECLEADRAICLLLWWKEGTVHHGMYTHVHVLTSDRAPSSNKKTRTEQLSLFHARLRDFAVICRSSPLAFLICAAKSSFPRNTGLNQFRVSASSSSLHYQRWAERWQKARAVVRLALLPIAMSWVSSKLGKMPLYLWIWAFCFFSTVNMCFYTKTLQVWC